MASAQPGVHALKLQPPTVSLTLRNGSNFIKWDEVKRLLSRIFLDLHICLHCKVCVRIFFSRGKREADLMGHVVMCLLFIC